MNQHSKKNEYQWFWTKLASFAGQRGLRHSKMREEILRHFLITGGHFDAKGLHASLARSGTNVGVATVFRTLKLMHEAGLAEQSGLPGDAAQFEVISPRQHHDHLVCLQCGLIIEFHDKALEVMKNKVARQHHFQLQSHRLVLYGLCKKCDGPPPPVDRALV